MAVTINADTSNGVIITPDTSGEIELQANGVTKAKVTANGLQDANGNSLRGGSYRNLIINGDMRIAQRGTSATGLGNGDTGYHTIDRWRFQESGTPTFEFTQTQDTDVPSGQGFSSSLKMSCTTAQGSLSSNNMLRIGQRIEAQNLQHLKYGTSSAESITISFWVKSNKTGDYAINIYHEDGVSIIGNVVTINSANTWEKKTITFVGNTTDVINNDNGPGLWLNFVLLAGTDYTGTDTSSWIDTTGINTTLANGQTVNLADSTSNYINITGVQLEVGEGASDFEFLPYDVQLARCQRYYEAHYNITWCQNSTGGFGNPSPISWVTQKRASPTTVIYSNATGTANAIRNNSTGTDVTGVSLMSVDSWTYASVNGTRTDGHVYAFNVTASAEL